MIHQSKTFYLFHQSFQIDVIKENNVVQINSCLVKYINRFCSQFEVSPDNGHEGDDGFFLVAAGQGIGKGQGGGHGIQVAGFIAHDQSVDGFIVDICFSVDQILVE